jgi:hypothetical protein
MDNTIQDIRNAWPILFKGHSAPTEQQLGIWLMDGPTAVKRAIARTARKNQRLGGHMSEDFIIQNVTGVLAQIVSEQVTIKKEETKCA